MNLANGLAVSFGVQIYKIEIVESEYGIKTVLNFAKLRKEDKGINMMGFAKAVSQLDTELDLDKLGRIALENSCKVKEV